jgi:HEAT repeat protein
MSSELPEKDSDVESLAHKALTDKETLTELLAGILSKKEEIRSPCFKALLRICEEQPELLYPHWDYFASLLESNNTFLKYQAIYLIASLTTVDTEKRFESIFDTYYGLLDDKSVIPSSHAALNSGKIARAKPALQTRITDRLLRIDETHHKPDRKDLIKSYVIDAFSEYFEAAEDKEMILEFVRKQLESSSPKTRKKAKEFLKKWGD